MDPQKMQACRVMDWSRDSFLHSKSGSVA
jgi:hypothetical protein